VNIYKSQQIATKKCNEDISIFESRVSL
jgi:hypothetical protein